MLYSQIIGEGTSDLLVIHGLFGSGDNWKSLAKNWSSQCDLKIHLIDLRNHGNSFWSNQMGFMHMTQDIAAYATSHNINQMTLLGHSLGGRVAMHYASNNPSKINRLLVVDIGPGKQPSRNDQVILGLEKVMQHSLKSRKEADSILKEYIPSVSVRLFLLRNLYYNAQKQLEFSMNVKSISRNRNILTMPLEINKVHSLETYLIRGEHSQHCQPRDFQLIQKYFPKSKLVTVKNAGHWVHADNPHEFTKEIIQRLSV